MVRKLINLVILLPIAIVLIVLCVANRQPVTLALNPFEPQDSLLSLTAPFFAFVFGGLIVGLIIGSLATWFTQGKHRQRARRHATEVSKWQGEAERQKSRADKVASQALIPTRSV
ncbi:DUF1049 domain-containing protein [Ensifer soli]|uniref:DUF1049 domain-containing protein n=1 Tax=Ciceribacter sp. sgz301302 TaxID=3342379 RepID=UPI0035B982F3